MSDIKIGRYVKLDGHEYSGHIEGYDDDGKSWIIFLDAKGRPSVYWPEREPDGGVIGECIHLP